MRSKQFVVLLVLAAVVGVVASLVAWWFLQSVHQLQDGIFHDLPQDLGYDHTPQWWPLPILALAGVLTALAITRLPGNGGHIPADGLATGTTQPIEMPGVLFAGFAALSLGIVLGPEGPLLALGGGLGILLVRLLRSDAPAEVTDVMGAAGMFAALSFVFGSPIVAAFILIEAAGIGGPRLPLILLPGLLAAGIGSLVATGLGDWTGLDTSSFSLPKLPLEEFARPDVTDFLWTVPLAAAVAIGIVVLFKLGQVVRGVVVERPVVTLPLAGLLVAGLAIAFSELADHSVDEVLFSGEEQLPGLISSADSWSLSALALVIGAKGLAYAISLGSFRGGPVFPALYLGAAAGLMAGQLPGFEVTPAVAVCLGAAVVAVLRLPLAAVVLAVLLTESTGAGASPLVIVGVVVAYLVTLLIDPPEPSAAPPAPAPASPSS
jgi:H+/Cl- antiporter ClcA